MKISKYSKLLSGLQRPSVVGACELSDTIFPERLIFGFEFFLDNFNAFQTSSIWEKIIKMLKNLNPSWALPSLIPSIFSWKFTSLRQTKVRKILKYIFSQRRSRRDLIKSGTCWKNLWVQKLFVFGSGGAQNLITWPTFWVVNPNVIVTASEGAARCLNSIFFVIWSPRQVG